MLEVRLAAVDLRGRLLNAELVLALAQDLLVSHLVRIATCCFVIDVVVVRVLDLLVVISLEEVSLEEARGCADLLDDSLLPRHVISRVSHFDFYN